jgi:serine/threonine-protein kinase RsbW
MTASSSSRGSHTPRRPHEPRRLTPRLHLAPDIALAPELRLVLPAEPEAVRHARAAFGEWLAGLRWPADGVVDLILAVNEAMANVVDHAYPAAEPGPVGVHARCGPGSAPGTRRITIAVVDHGDWNREHRAVDPAGARGNGLALMYACTAETRIVRSAHGTTVTLVSNDVPALWPARRGDSA